MLATDRIHEVVKGYEGDPYCQEVLLFLSRHPRTRFSRLAVVYALDRHQRYIELALNRLTSDGAVNTCCENGVPLYSLAEGR